MFFLFLWGFSNDTETNHHRRHNLCATDFCGNLAERWVGDTYRLCEHVFESYVTTRTAAPRNSHAVILWTGFGPAVPPELL